jgi:CRISPR-associated protein Cmr1
MVAELREIEGAIFGDTEKSSPLVVPPPELPATKKVIASNPDADDYPGLRYLGYGLYDDKQPPPEGLSVPPSDPIRLTLRFRREVAGARDVLAATLWLWAHLGGIGARSRRGFGGVGVVNHTGLPPSAAPHFEPVSDHAHLVKRLLDGLDWVTQVFRETLPRFRSNPIEVGSGPHPAIRTIDGLTKVTVLAGHHPSAQVALDQAGRFFRDFRSSLQRGRARLPPLADYFTVKTALQNQRAAHSVERAAFGLPLPFFFRSLGGMKTKFDLGDDGDRLASPLLFRVHRLTQGAGGAPCFVVLLANLAEGNGADPLNGMDVFQERLGQIQERPDGKIIGEFIDWAADAAKREATR